MHRIIYKTKDLSVQALHDPAFSGGTAGAHARRRSPVLSRRELRRLVRDMVG